MRRVFIILLVVAGLIACTNDSLQEGVVIDNTPQTQQFDPNRRSFSETVEIAQNSIRMLEEDMVETRGVSPARRLNLESGVKAFRQVSTRSDSPTSDNDTLLYVFNFDDNQGFAVVSASRHTEGLIAVVEEGSYDPAVPTGNPGFDTYMKRQELLQAFRQ